MEATYTRTTWRSVLQQALSGDLEAIHRLDEYVRYLDHQFDDCGYDGVLSRPESFSSDPEEAARNRDEECS